VDSIGVVIGTFGSNEWGVRGAKALASLRDQSCLPDEMCHIHTDSLHEARNRGAESLNVDWLIFLDADDRLHEDYVLHMSEATKHRLPSLWQPSTIGSYPGGLMDDEPVLISKKDIKKSNYLVIGTMCKAEMFHDVGGFKDYPILEDWDLWIRMHKAGAIVGACPEAVYIVNVRDNSRNSNTKLHNNVYNRIRRDNGIGR
jgi:hypothetical protein